LQKILHRKGTIMRAWLMMAAVGLSAVSVAAEEKYLSPYAVEYKHPRQELIRDLEGERGNPQTESVVPHAEWYSRKVREKWGSWGPAARHYPFPEIVSGKSADWKRERVIATALQFQGYEYQHHHIPNWHPPEGWPWMKVGAGHNGKGLDCSNFSAFVYNLGFGIKPSGDIKEQAAELSIPGPGREIRATRIDKPRSYAEFAKTLKTGDLLYIKGRPDGEVTHVVIWVGAIGKSKGDVPLLLDSHGATVQDSNGIQIPNGIHLRPFLPDSWYFRSASHAHRIIHD